MATKTTKAAKATKSATGDRKGPFVKYVGAADKRTISATAWRSLGIPATEGHEWSAANNYLIESSAFSDAQLDHLLHDDVQHGTNAPTFIEVNHDEDHDLVQTAR